MAIPFTAVDLATRKILYTGFCDVPEAINAVVFKGIRADPKFYRITSDGNWVELKPELVFNFSSVIVAAGGTVSLTTHDSVNVYIDDVLLVENITELDILFEESGDYKIDLLPVQELVLPATQMIEVT